MPDTTIELGVLNIVAQPHDPGVYRALLEQAAGREINFWGDLNAAIRAPREVEPGVFQAEIVIGTEIDLDEPLIDRQSLEQIPAQEADVRISNAHLYNGRVFLYTFVENRHLLFFETLNEFGKRLSPSRADKIFSKLFSINIAGFNGARIDVTVVPEDDTLDRLLGLPRLDRVDIYLKRPNPADINPDEAALVLAELEDQGAKSQVISLKRAPGVKRIVLNAQNYAKAAVAQFNGFVRAAGMTEDGEKYSGSTKSYPKIIKVAIDAATSAAATARRIAREYRTGRQREPERD